MKRALSILVFIVVFHQNHAQVTPITEETKLAFEKEANLMVRNLQSRFKAIIKTKGNPELQQSLKNSLIERFMPNSYVEVANIIKGKTVYSKILIQEYTNRIGRYEIKYELVDIYFTSFNVDQLVQDKNDPNLFKLTFSYTQTWKAVLKGKNTKTVEGLTHWDLEDVDKKVGEIYLKRINTASGNKYKLYFSNISVASHDSF